MAVFPIVIVGQVDHGKSTLIGRLLHDAGALSEAKIAEINRVSDRRGGPVEWSYALDAMQVERDQAITVDSSHVWFQTATRAYVVVDVPGHHELLRNMVTGAAQADAAVLVVDAVQGLTDQTRHHARILALLGVGEAIVAVNKMDSVGFARGGFDAVAADVQSFADEIGLRITTAIPVSARHGDNLVGRSPHTPWWTGPTLCSALDQLSPRPRASDLPLRLSVQDVYRRDGRRVIVGRIDAGRLKVGDSVALWPGDRRAKVAAFDTWNAATPLVAASAPQSVALTLDRELLIERGHVIAAPDAPPHVARRLSVRMFWLSGTPLTEGRRLRLTLGTAAIDVVVSDIHSLVEHGSLAAADNAAMSANAIADVTLSSQTDVIYDTAVGDRHVGHAPLGRGSLVDSYEVVGGCIVLNDDDADRAISAYATAPRLSGRRGEVFWLTGLSGAGKSTLAKAVQQGLRGHHSPIVVIDGDDLRAGVSADLGFDDAARAENVRRGAEVAKLLADQGVDVIAAFMSPRAAHRALARRIVGAGFHEVFVDADVEDCAGRDVKGLYARARRGALADLAGVSGVWEPPQAPDISIATGREPLDRSVQCLLAYIARATERDIAVA